MLDEVAIVAFGTQKKESVIASISTIKPAELKVPSSNLTTALAGRMAGIMLINAAVNRAGQRGLLCAWSHHFRYGKKRPSNTY